MIQFININKIFNQGEKDEIHALKKINFNVNENEFILLRGASGSGKSTILSIVGGLIKPTDGEVIVDGKSIAKLPDKFSSLLRREKIGFIFQKFNLISDLSVYDNIIIPLIPGKLSRTEIESKVDKLLSDFSLNDKKNILVKKLSGGEQQRVAIARALINNPKIILADEPTANLDEKLSNDFIEIIKKLKSNGITILLASHDPLFNSLEFLDNIIDIHLGEIR
ncbi:MAG: ABC transporter ATP-binding protein [Ignavibacteriales bacterium]|nr:ABC transporter ATP-binding protein [Ignavibacteriales bacterium]